MSKILVVEDDHVLANTIKNWLKLEHYLVETIDNGQDALALLQTYKYDLIVLDWALPQLSGLEICKQFRFKGGTTPILILTGKDTIDEKEQGFGAGADDYLTKPFHMKELSARLRALLRRATVSSSENLRVGNLVLEPRTYRVTKDGVDINLAKTEFALLEFFMRHPNEVFSGEALLDRVWTSDSEASIDTVRTYIKRLRSKIDTAEQSSMLRTIHGVGYKLEAP